MKKSELRQLIKECYTEVMLENSNPFFDAEIKEESNPFFDATISELKVPGKYTKDADIETMDAEARRIYKDMVYALGNIGEKSTAQSTLEAIRRIPLIDQVLTRRYFTVGIDNSDYGIRGEPVKAAEYQARWDSVLGGRSARIPDNVKQNAQELLKMLKANDGKLMSTGDYLVFKSTDGQDSIKIWAYVKDPSILIKIFSFGSVGPKLGSFFVDRATGVFDALSGVDLSKDKAALHQFGKAILKSVKRQGGQVSVKGSTITDPEKYPEDKKNLDKITRVKQ